MRRRRSRTILALAGTATLIGHATLASSTPPKTAPSFEGTYTVTTELTVDGRPESRKAVIRISVDGKRSRWEYQGAGRVVLYDYDAKTMTMANLQSAEKTALQDTIPASMSQWEFGYGTIAADAAAPERGKLRTVGGVDCLELRFKSTRYGNPELCVTEHGTVARFHLATKGSSSTFEAQDLRPGPQPASTFDLPDGFKVTK